VGEVVPDGVELGREVIAFGLPLLADQGRLILVMVHVMGNRSHIVEELGVDGPALVLVPHFLPDEAGAFGHHRFQQGEAFAIVDHVAEAFVVRAVVVAGFRSGREPALVDAAAMRAQGVIIVGMELKALAGHQEGSGHPARGQAEDAFARLDGGLHIGFLGCLGYRDCFRHRKLRDE
jgi:hypothetical protein